MNMNFPEEIIDRLNVASAAVGLSIREYAMACLEAGLATHYEHDPIVAACFKVMAR
jgi:plasmid stability protein